MRPLHPAQAVTNLKGDMQGENEVTRVTLIDDDGVLEIQTLTFVAKASTDAGDFVVIENVDGETWAIWLDKTGADSTPSGPIFTGTDHQVKVDISAISTSAEIATAVFTAIENSITDVTVANPSAGVVRLTQDIMGDPGAPVPKNAAENAAGSIVGATTAAGIESAYGGTHFTFKNGANAAFYAWFNVNDEAADPAPGGTGVEVAVAVGDTKQTIAAALVTAINLVSGFDADHEGLGVVKLAATAVGTATDASAGTAPVSVSVPVQGGPKKYAAADAPSTISNNPTAF